MNNQLNSPFNNNWMNAPQNYYTPTPQQMPMNNYGVTYQPNYQQNMNLNNNQKPELSGRIVGNESEVKPNEVPMDGRISFFPTSDYSRIFAKAWQSDGTIKTVIYAPVVENAVETNQDVTSVILKRLENIEKMLSKKPYRKPYNKPYNKNTSKDGAENV